MVQFTLRSLPLRLLVPVLLGGLAGGVRADVLVVDPQGGPGQALLTAALAAAQPGDILLLRAGDYSAPASYVITKGLTLQADTGELVVLPGLATQAPAGPAVVLRGLRCEVPAGTPAFAALHVGGAALTWAEDCTFVGRDGFGTTPPSEGVTVGALPKTVLVRCTAVGGNALFGETGGDGFRTGGGPTLLQDCTGQGGAGGAGAGDPPLGLDGGSGLLALFGMAIVDGGSFVGGAETDPSQPTAASGAGLYVAMSLVLTRQIRAAAGDFSLPGVSGPAIFQELGYLQDFPLPLPRVHVDSPLRAGAGTTLVASGPAGAALFVVAGFEPVMLPTTGKPGANLIAAPSAAIFVGVATGPAGEAQLDLHVPPLPTGIDGERLVLQSWALATTGAPLAGTGSAVTWLAASL